ncbi:TPA: hypothetical protein DEP96_04050 [Candidatus Uhrbacteria bacterium]|nr:hypothetical protein [Candidatus Uhrbacteria bacterium]
METITSTCYTIITMIYLIGGAPRTGKSIVSSILMRELSVPWLSTDALSTVVHNLTPISERAEKFPYKGFTNVDQLSEIEIQQKVDWQITEANSLQIAIDSLIRHQVGVNDNQILEGVHILPQHVRTLLDDPATKDQIRVVFILSDDEPIQLQAMRQNTSHHDWLAGASDETFQSVAAFVIRYSQWLTAECDKYRIPYIIRRGAFEAENNEIIRLLQAQH